MMTLPSIKAAEIRLSLQSSKVRQTTAVTHPACYVEGLGKDVIRNSLKIPDIVGHVDEIIFFIFICRENMRLQRRAVQF